MEFLSLFLYISIAVPLSVVLIMSKSKTKSLICFVIIGLTVALFSGELNAIIYKLLPYSQVAYVTTFSPMIEEALKMLPIFICVFATKPSRQDIIERAIAVGVGFAILENAFVFANNSVAIDFITALLRAFGAGMMHVMTMLFVGFGLYYVNNKRKLLFSGSVGLIATAIIYHSVYNYLVCCGHYIAGFLMPTLIFIPTMLFIKKICKNN